MGSNALLPKNPDKYSVYLDIRGHSFQELPFSSNCVIKVEFILLSSGDCAGLGRLEEGIWGWGQEVSPGGCGDLPRES